MTGAGKGFCAGADMGMLQTIQSGDAATSRGAVNAATPWDASANPNFQKQYSWFPAVPKPIIAAINGPAAGLGLIMALYNDITSRLDDPDTYEPLIEEDIDGTFLWEFWAEGFGKAIALRPWAWSTFKDRPDDDQAADAFGMLVALATIARATDEDPELYDELDEQVSYEAPQMIATCVIELHHDRLSNHQLKPRTEKVGRNDPCPCGSGKKYKKCCLQAEKT